MNERVYACFGQCERGWPGCNVDARVGECEGGPARTRATDAYATQRDNSHLSDSDRSAFLFELDVTGLSLSNRLSLCREKLCEHAWA